MSPKKSIALATATLQDIISCGHRMSSANIRGSDGASQQPIRDQAHALLDAYLDQMAAAGKAAADILED
ncbi:MULTISPECIES: hypothetical protein [unclassified Brevundimonas]|uniref:hypothetical protein n=1 Tax=unclassified Brevundimonas TaxID=2622653 RepID=UPI0025B97406|nr:MULTISPECIES: hypothetical protein [unclassified Brevundimonas]